MTPLETSCLRLRTILVCTALLLCAGPSWADDAGLLDDRFSFTFGSYFLSSETRIRVDEVEGIGIPGTEFGFENAFEMGDDTVFRLAGSWRFKPRHALHLMYFDSDRSRTRSFERDIVFEGETYPLGADGKGDFDFSIVELAYAYSFIRNERVDFSGSAGIHNVRFKVALRADVMLPGATTSRRLEEDASTDAPLPVVGLKLTWRMGGDWYLQAHAQYFQLEYEGLDGSLQDYQAGVLWQFADHFGVGAAYNLFNLDVDAEHEDKFHGALDWEYSGPQVFLLASF